MSRKNKLRMHIFKKIAVLVKKERVSTLFCWTSFLAVHKKKS